eukprot:731921_1
MSVLSWNPSLTDLRLADHPDLGFPVLLAASSFGRKQLKVLDMSNCGFDGNAGVPVIFDNLCFLSLAHNNLDYFSLTFSNPGSGGMFPETLSHLDLSRCLDQHAHMDGFTFLERCSTSLSHLSLSGLRLQRDQLIHLVTNLPQLVYLDVSGNKLHSFWTTLAETQRTSKVKVLIFNDCRGFSEVENLCDVFRSLETLSLATMLELRDEDLSELAIYASDIPLTRLNLSSCIALTHEGLLPLVRACLCLTEVLIGGCYYIERRHFSTLCRVRR